MASVDASEEVRPFTAIPLASKSWPLLGHLPLMMAKDSQERMHLLFEELRKESGDIFRLHIPGQPKMVVCSNPEYIKVMYSNEPKIPVVPGFAFMEHTRRNAMRDR